MIGVKRLYGLLVGANLIDGIVATYLPLALAVSGASAATIGMLSFFALIPWVLSPWVGALVDRSSAGWMLAVATLIRPVALGLVGVSAWLAGTSPSLIWCYFALAFFAACIDMATDISSQSYASTLAGMGRNEKIYGPIASIQTVCGSLVAPAIAGLLVGFSPAFIIIMLGCCAITLVSLVGLGKLHAPVAKVRSERTRLSADVSDGLRTIWSNPWLRRSAVTVGFLNISAAANGAISVVYIVRYLHVDAKMIGIAFSVVGLAGALGGLLVSLYSERVGFGVAVMLGGGAFVLDALAPVLGGNLGGIVAMWGIAALFLPFFGVSLISERQRRCDPAMVGRVNGAFQLVGIGIAPVGGLLGGVLGSATSLVVVLWLTAGLSAGAIVVGRPWQL